MKLAHTWMVTIGASAGGMDALSRFVAQLPADFPAAIFIVQHAPADAKGDALVKALIKNTTLPCKHPFDREKIQPSNIYVAPSDHHMILEEGCIRITKGFRENRSRPAIDPLFRSAAVTYGSRVIGILLTGYLDDGTSGLIAIQRCGGKCIVQDPADAAYPDMPENALNNLKVDYCIPVGQMGAIVNELVRMKPNKAISIPKDIEVEANIAKRVLSDLPAMESLGDQDPFNCPECGGVLRKIAIGKLVRFRCHTGHAFTSGVFLAEQTAKIEETLWVALRMFEERKNLLQTMIHSGKGAPSRSASERAAESEVHIDRIRAMLISSDKASNDEAPTKMLSGKIKK